MIVIGVVRSEWYVIWTALRSRDKKQRPKNHPNRPYQCNNSRGHYAERQETAHTKRLEDRAVEVDVAVVEGGHLELAELHAVPARRLRLLQRQDIKQNLIEEF